MSHIKSLATVSLLECAFRWHNQCVVSLYVDFYTVLQYRCACVSFCSYEGRYIVLSLYLRMDCGWNLIRDLSDRLPKGLVTKAMLLCFSYCLWRNIQQCPSCGECSFLLHWERDKQSLLFPLAGCLDVTRRTPPLLHWTLFSLSSSAQTYPFQEPDGWTFP